MVLTQAAETTATSSQVNHMEQQTGMAGGFI
jgi:hypothetical protein